MNTFTRTDPFLATLTKRYPLTKDGSQKKTYHIELDLTGSNLCYKPGDSVGIYPINDPSYVQQILHSLKVSGEEKIVTKEGNMLSIYSYLSSKVNMGRCSKKLLHLLQQRGSLLSLQEEDLKDLELIDLLKTSMPITPQELCDLCSPLLPRFYSIASCQSTVAEQVHLTVALSEYEIDGEKRAGVASHYLCHLAPEFQPAIPLYIQPSKDFTTPIDPNALIIMVGPGTGVAPYRAFMQERVSMGCKGKNWLFFGEKNRATDFYYEEYWQQLVKEGYLRLDVAFSRDQKEKIYVQHRMLEQAAELYRWLQAGAYLYVCGDALHMAKDVDQALHTIIAEQSREGIDYAKAAIKLLRKQGRYLRDIY